PGTTRPSRWPSSVPSCARWATVRTSARLDSRAPHGFGAFLQNLALPMEAAAPAAPAGGSPAGLRTETGRK
ncbi:hypothetical protein ABT366_36665, partial [Streptomyces lydicus]|uniref:hypothetical protein n=1 Tax=Streptomyces lydicus TaxID=47763 RepID=UPI00332E6431